MLMRRSYKSAFKKKRNHFNKERLPPLHIGLALETRNFLCPFILEGYLHLARQKRLSFSMSVACSRPTGCGNDANRCE